VCQGALTHCPVLVRTSPAADRRRREAVATRRLQAARTGELGDEHDIATTTHELGDAGVAQHVRRQLKPGDARDLAHDEIDGTRGQPAPTAADQQRRLTLRDDLRALVAPGIDRVPSGPVQRNLSERVALARSSTRCMSHARMIVLCPACSSFHAIHSADDRYTLV
jgi:hypothetical protein